MKIDLSKMRLSWWEDKDGNVLELDKYQVPTEEQKERYKFYHSAFPCTYTHDISVYDYNPKGIYRFLIKIPILNKYIKAKIGKTFRNMCSFKTSYTSGCSCINAMVNSGDYTLQEAIWVYANACERCMNALEYKYLNQTEGYAEHSNEWNRCNTICDFCEMENNDKS